MVIEHFVAFRITSATDSVCVCFPYVRASATCSYLALPWKVIQPHCSVSVKGRGSIVEKQVPSAQFIAGEKLIIQAGFTSLNLLAVDRYICRAHGNAVCRAAITMSFRY